MKRIPLAIVIATASMTFLAGALYAGTINSKSFTDPDAGRSPAEVEAAQKAATDTFLAQLPIWIREQRGKIGDPAILPRAAILASEGAPPQTLASATKQADAIAHGKVSSIEFRDTGDTVVTLQVTDTMKGSIGDHVAVLFVGGLRPVPDWDHVALAYLESAPIPNVGDDLVLFLAASVTDKGLYEPESYTGMYWVENSGLRGLDGNPLAEALKTESVASLTAMIQAITSKD